MVIGCVLPNGDDAKTDRHRVAVRLLFKDAI